MTLDYLTHSKTIEERLLDSHDPKKATIRSKMLQSENNYFRANINNQNVLVAGSGLGHDTYELARYNRHVTGIELVPEFVDYSRRHIDLPNVNFVNGDFTDPKSIDGFFDSSVLNMGTIGNFDDPEEVIRSLLDVSSSLYFDFYFKESKALEKRERMYKEEGWKNIRVIGDMIVSDDGIEFKSFSEEEMDSIMASIERSAEYSQLNDFVVMAKVT